jgi:hypothetical protein
VHDAVSVGHGLQTDAARGSGGDPIVPPHRVDDRVGSGALPRRRRVSEGQHGTEG